MLVEFTIITHDGETIKEKKAFAEIGNAKEHAQRMIRDGFCYKYEGEPGIFIYRVDTVYFEEVQVDA